MAFLPASKPLCPNLGNADENGGLGSREHDAVTGKNCGQPCGRGASEECPSFCVCSRDLVRVNITKVCE